MDAVTVWKLTKKHQAFLAIACLVTLATVLTAGGRFTWRTAHFISSGVIPSDSVTRSIIFMKGWENYKANPKDRPGYISCLNGNYTCTMDYSSSLTPDSSDIAIFHESGMLQSPPFKRRGQLWVFRTGESQQSLTADHMELWDRYFNYTIDHREGATQRTYVTRARRLTPPTKRNFVKEKLRLLNQAGLPANALWLVSNCKTEGTYKVRSGRAEYARELSQWINIAAYTSDSRSNLCPRNDFVKPLLKDKTDGKEQTMSQFTFYLSFENILCADYITEKLWKVLQSDDLTIPVVMGGQSMLDYKSITPPNSYIDVRNFTSPKRLAEHLNYVAKNPDAFNYYHQWRNEYTFKPSAEKKQPGVDSICKFCIWAWDHPGSVIENMGEHFNKSQCLDLSKPADHCRYYNLQCAKDL